MLPRQVHAFKPATSKEGNSEMYVVCKGFRIDELTADQKSELLRKCHTGRLILQPSLIPDGFTEELLKCATFFKELQCKVIEKNLKLDLIEPSRSPYASGIILVRKSTGRHQIACNLDKLNKKTVKNCYPLPLLHDNLACLANAKFLSSIENTSSILICLPDR